MTERIRELVRLTLAGEMFNKPRATEFDREDLFLTRQQRESKRLCEYILNQEPVLTEYSSMTGFFRCDGSVVGEVFHRRGHVHFEELRKLFYLQPVDGLSTFEWQHATADYQKVLSVGIGGIIAEIDRSLETHTAEEEIDFLLAMKRVANALIAWAHKCSERAADFAATVEDPQHRENLGTLSRALLKVPERAPENFYEAVLTIYLCFSADPDSVGTLDRYLRPFYEKDLAAGVISREKAKEYLQELFLMLQASVAADNVLFTRGAESHFCVGGYLPDGEDGFCDLSRLILEGLMELPTWIPQVSLRWTRKTPKEVFRYVLDCERHDPNKRIAFQNDEKRVRAYTEICGFPFEKAVQYTTVGCNEPAFLGAVVGCNSKINFMHSFGTLFHEKSDRIVNVKDYEEFYRIWREELFSDLTRGFAYDDSYNRVRAEDVNYLSSLFFQGCVAKAKSLTQGACDYVVGSPMMIGIPNGIDSLIVVKQFVFDEKAVTMAQLIEALHANWEGFGDLRTLILKKGDFFGNDTPRSNEVAQRLYRDLYEFMKDRKNLFGYHWLVGDLIGYNEHHRIFGELVKATPDGRRDGEMLKFGLGQSGGHDRCGLTALLNSIASVDPSGIGCGSTVTNLTLEESMIRDDANFEKTVDLLETYFKNGGVHFQLNYVSREDLIRAKASPEEYRNLRVRVSGFSEYFVKLKESIQDSIIARTAQK